MTTEKKETTQELVIPGPEAGLSKLGDELFRELKLGTAPKDVKSMPVATATVHKIVEVRNKRKELLEAAKAIKEKLDAAVAKVTDRMDEAVSVRMEPLAKWAWLVLRGEKTKSKNLEGVKVGFRKGQGKLEVVDENAALQYCKDNELPFKVKESVDKKALKEFLKGNPEEIKALDGTVEYTTSGERFYVG